MSLAKKYIYIKKKAIKKKAGIVPKMLKATNLSLEFNPKLGPEHVRPLHQTDDGKRVLEDVASLHFQVKFAGHITLQQTNNAKGITSYN